MSGMDHRAYNPFLHVEHDLTVPDLGRSEHRRGQQPGQGGHPDGQGRGSRGGLGAAPDGHDEEEVDRQRRKVGDHDQECRCAGAQQKHRKKRREAVDDGAGQKHVVPEDPGQRRLAAPPRPKKSGAGRRSPRNPGGFILCRGCFWGQWWQRGTPIMQLIGFLTAVWRGSMP